MGVRRWSQAGFSLIEAMIATGMTGVIVLGASSVMTTTVTSQKRTDVQSLIDREFAAGAQIAANAEVVRDIVRPDLFGDTCLTKDRNSGCMSHVVPTWTPYPTPDRRTFNSTFNLQGPCAEGDPRCMVKRRMEYRWVCSDTECSGVETRVKVEPLQKEANSYRPRETIVKLDRRQLMARADLTFSCTNINQSLTSLDFAQAHDDCSVKPETNCPNMPGKTYNPFLPQSANCADGLNSYCELGYDYTGFFSNGYNCKAPEPNGPPQSAESVGPANYTSNAAPPPTADNPSTSYQTHIEVATATVTTTITETYVPPAPVCDMSTHTLYEYFLPSIGGYYYPPSPGDTTALGQGYYLTGNNFQVFLNDCPSRPRSRLVDCFVQGWGVGYHYLANEGCGLGGSSVGTFGFTEKAPGPGYTRTLSRYASGSMGHRSVIGGGAGSWEGDQGHIP
jgi:type II secretory pathway pseudopilin PulG